MGIIYSPGVQTASRGPIEVIGISAKSSTWILFEDVEERDKSFDAKMGLFAKHELLR
jgi:hypothetical protein